MKKVVQISFGNYYYERLMRPVRRKQDNIALILDILNILMIGEEQDSIKGKIVIKVDKMSRLFCFLEEKYFSMVFPFDIEQQSGNENVYRIYDAAWDMEIDNRIVVLLERMLNRIDFVKNSVDEIIENAYLDVSEEEYTEGEISNCFGLMLRLLSMELGYIRYDYDPEHENGDVHPLHHLDINYSSRGTYKLGVKKKMEKDEFVDLLDIKTDCKYVI
ncbi:MAG: hypothetical protein II312_09400 [Lachnospiraceae bacterium]|nr:hypothetical protein [Lachnospiraceae bacterium]